MNLLVSTRTPKRHYPVSVTDPPFISTIVVIPPTAATVDNTTVFSQAPPYTLLTTVHSTAEPICHTRHMSSPNPNATHAVPTKPLSTVNDATSLSRATLTCFQLVLLKNCLECVESTVHLNHDRVFSPLATPPYICHCQGRCHIREVRRLRPE